MNIYWNGRGYQWEYDPGPPKNRSWPRLFAETPNYRKIGKEVLGREKFRWHFGPMFYRGRLWDNSVKVLVIGQEGAQDECLAHRAFTGGTGSRLQYFLNYIGITESYLFLNTFVYPIYGQYGSSLKWIAQDPDSPIVQHRHEIFNYVLKRNDVHLVIAVGNAAKESVVTWIKSRGGTCPQGAKDISKCSASNLDPFTKIIGVMHPGGAARGGSRVAIIKDFKKAANKIKKWMDEDPNWLRPDPAGSRKFDQPYKYGSAPIPFYDFSYGFPMRLGRGGTSSNRKDRQRSIQIFSAKGTYNARNVPLVYNYQAEGSNDGYTDEPGDIPYEPPKKKYRDYDKGPGRKFARLFMGSKPGLEWPDFNAMGAAAHPSFGQGAIFRGRPGKANVLILADQQSHDDLFTGRALTGMSGQHVQELLKAMGIIKRYVIIRTLPIDTLDLEENEVEEMIHNAQIQKVLQAIVDKIIDSNKNLKLFLSFGPQSREMTQFLNLANLPVIELMS